MTRAKTQKLNSYAFYDVVSPNTNPYKQHSLDSVSADLHIHETAATNK